MLNTARRWHASEANGAGGYPPALALLEGKERLAGEDLEGQHLPVKALPVEDAGLPVVHGTSPGVHGSDAVLSLPLEPVAGVVGAGQGNFGLALVEHDASASTE